MNANPPKCATEGCDNPAMVQCPDCAMHWNIRFSAWWDARWPDEDESLPFQEGAEEAREDYAPDAAYADQG